MKPCFKILLWLPVACVMCCNNCQQAVVHNSTFFCIFFFLHAHFRCTGCASFFFTVSKFRVFIATATAWYTHRFRDVLLEVIRGHVFVNAHIVSWIDRRLKCWLWWLISICWNEGIQGQTRRSALEYNYKAPAIKIVGVGLLSVRIMRWQPVSLTE